MSDGELLEVRGLCSGYGTAKILDGVSFAIGRGEIVSVVGRNGVGKTTLMRTLLGGLPAMGGSVYLKGCDITRRAPFERARRGIGYVPQGRHLFPQMTVRENLELGRATLGKAPPELTDVLYGFFPILQTRATQRAGSLSGGEQQQVATARALYAEPEVLLLDEPSEGIQPSVVNCIADAMRSMNRDRKLTILLVEQNFEMIRRMAQRGYVMDKGKLVAELGVAELTDVDVLQQYLSFA